MAIVSRQPKEITVVEPYMEQYTFVRVSFKAGPPQLPPRHFFPNVFPSLSSDCQPTPCVSCPSSLTFSLSRCPSEPALSPVPFTSFGYTSDFYVDHNALMANNPNPWLSPSAPYNPAGMTCPSRDTSRKPQPAKRSRSFNKPQTLNLSLANGGEGEANCANVYTNTSGLAESSPSTSPKKCSPPSTFYTNAPGGEESSAVAEKLALMSSCAPNEGEGTARFSEGYFKMYPPTMRLETGPDSSSLQSETATQSSPKFCGQSEPSRQPHMYTNTEEERKGMEAEEEEDENPYCEPSSFAGLRHKTQTKTHIVRPFITSAEIRAEDGQSAGSSETINSSSFPPLPRYSDALLLLPPAPAPPVYPRSPIPPPRSQSLSSSSVPSPPRPRSRTLQATVNDGDDQIYSNTMALTPSPVYQRPPLTAATPPPLLPRSPRYPPRLGHDQNAASEAAGAAVGSESSEKKPAQETPLDSPETKIDVSKLSVDEVAIKLKELGLHRYRKKFKNSRIDGVLLKRLSSETLRKEFKMTKVETIRLETFAQYGHIPQKSSKKKSKAKS